MKSKLIRSIMGLVTLTVGMTSMTAFADIYSDAGRVRRVDDAVGGMTLYGQPMAPVGSMAPIPLPPPSNAYGKSWTSYFLGQSKSGVTINYDGTLADQNYGPGGVPPGTVQMVWPAPQGATPVDAQLAAYCSGQNNFVYGGYTITPLFTQDALLNGGPPYDWNLVLKPASIFSLQPGACSFG